MRDVKPEYIYLQQFDGEQRTWCEDQINIDDDPYISLSEHKRLLDISIKHSSSGDYKKGYIDGLDVAIGIIFDNYTKVIDDNDGDWYEACKDLQKLIQDKINKVSK